MIPLDKVMCNPPGSIRTALDIELDQVPKRMCGMCQRDVTGKTLGDTCPHCHHLFGWFQLLTDVTAVGVSPKTEKALAAYIKRYQAKQQDDIWADGAW